MTPYGALSINASSTAFYVGPTASPTKLTGWSAHSVRQEGDLSVVPNTTDSRLTLQPGIYRVVAKLDMEGETVGGTSGDAVGFITGQLFKAGVAVSGAVDRADVVADGTPDGLHIEDIIEITEAQKVAGTNYVDVRLSSADASGNDVIVRNARLIAYKIAG